MTTKFTEQAITEFANGKRDAGKRLVSQLLDMQISDSNMRAEINEYQHRTGDTSAQNELGAIGKETALEPNTPKIGLNDASNSLRFVKLHGDKFRYVHTWGWMAWNGQYWERDTTGMAMRAAKETARSIYLEAANIEDADISKKFATWACASLNKPKLDAMLGAAQSELPIPARPDDFDKDPWLLNVENGTLDMRTGELRAHDPSDKITKIAGTYYDPSATCTLWLSFLNRIMGNNQDLIAYLQRAVGYSLTGDTSEQCFFFCYGTGANGKSVFLEALRSVLGDFAAQSDFGTFLDHNDNAIRNDIARLAGSRFVSAIEAGEGKRLSEKTLKQLSGEDKVTARFLYHEDFEFMPKFKVWLAANHKPVIKDTTESTWRRVRLIPFAVTIPESERDPKMSSNLKSELPGILAWAVKGCIDWQNNRLGTPQVVRDATNIYRSEMDTFAQFISECCELNPSGETTAKELYEAYQTWCTQSGEHAETKKAFGMRLTENGLRKEHRRDGSWWYGIKLQARTVDLSRL